MIEDFTKIVSYHGSLRIKKKTKDLNKTLNQHRSQKIITNKKKIKMINRKPKTPKLTFHLLGGGQESGDVSVLSVSRCSRGSSKIW